MESTKTKQIEYPGICDIGDIPDYMAVIYVLATENYFPEYLKNHITHRYMIIGGRASNEYSKKKVLSADWDMVVEFVGENEAERSLDAVNLVDDINKFIRDRISNKYSEYYTTASVSKSTTSGSGSGTVINVKTDKKDFGGHFLFQLGIVDPYTGRDFKFADIHMCHDSTIKNVGNYCNYLSGATLHSGIMYAPLEYLKPELIGVEENRRKTSTSSKKIINEDFPEDMEYMRGVLIDKFEDIEDLIDRIYDHNKIVEIKKLKNEFKSLLKEFDIYSEYCDSKLYYWILAYKENIKYARTKDRLENLS